MVSDEYAVGLITSRAITLCLSLIEQVERFLAAHPDFELVDAAPLLAARTPLHIEGPYLSLRPDVHGTDGFFAAVMERKKDLVEAEPVKKKRETENSLDC